MKKTLQSIEDYYLSQGFKREKLRKILEDDKEFQALLKNKKAEVKNKYGISDVEEKEYLLPNEEDYQVLAMTKKLKTKKLSTADGEVVDLIVSQLKADWREYLFSKLNRLLKKYRLDK